MIGKIPNTPRINEIRVIMFYEVHYNLLPKFFWSKISTQYIDTSNFLLELTNENTYPIVV